MPPSCTLLWGFQSCSRTSIDSRTARMLGPWNHRFVGLRFACIATAVISLLKPGMTFGSDFKANQSELRICFVRPDLDGYTHSESDQRKSEERELGRSLIQTHTKWTVMGTKDKCLASAILSRKSRLLSGQSQDRHRSDVDHISKP